MSALTPNFNNFPSSGPESLLDSGVSELVQTNLRIIDSYIASNGGFDFGQPLSVVPQHYRGEEIQSSVKEEVSEKALQQLRTAVGGSEPITEELPYGTNAYWSFDREGRQVFITETRLYPNVKGSQYQVSPLTAGVSLTMPQHIEARNTEVLLVGPEITQELTVASVRTKKLGRLAVKRLRRSASDI
ncbi:MAG: hypothetical protein QFB87_04145 [Patescibacteria group bacterium]|nr:hypothetical protein [Patescibacteria group bacterium]